MTGYFDYMHLVVNFNRSEPGWRRREDIRSAKNYITFVLSILDGRLLVTTPINYLGEKFITREGTYATIRDRLPRSSRDLLTRMIAAYFNGNIYSESADMKATRLEHGGGVRHVEGSRYFQNTLESLGLD